MRLAGARQSGVGLVAIRRQARDLLFGRGQPRRRGLRLVPQLCQSGGSALHPLLGVAADYRQVENARQQCPALLFRRYPLLARDLCTGKSAGANCSRNDARRLRWRRRTAAWVGVPA